MKRVVFSWMAGCLVVLLGLGCGDDGSTGGNNTSDGGLDGQASDAQPDGGVSPALVGDACWQDADCPAGGMCWSNLDGFPGGFCVLENCTSASCPDGAECVDFNDGVSRCVPSCTAHADCRQEHGYICDDNDTCWPGDGTVPPGGPCGADEHCQGGADAYCLLHSDFPGGYCVISDCTALSCPVGSHCASIFSEGGMACVPDCIEDGDCGPGYICNDSGGSWDGTCFPGCGGDQDCPGALGCRMSETFESTAVCQDVSHECSVTNHSGDCPMGQVCNQGVCEPFVCADTVLEPNETRATAAALPAADTPGLQICGGDHDWFEFTPGQAGVVYQVGIDSNYASGNLDVEFVTGADEIRDDARLVPTAYHEENPVGPMNMQLHSMVGATGSDPYWLHVRAVGLATNNYSLVVRETLWQDGANCEALFDAQTCRSQYAGGSHDPSRLIVFPQGNPADPFIGDAVYFDNGLSAFGNPPTTFSSARYARRELIMAVRNAVNAVQTEFPGTAPLGIGEVSMPDGTTPSGHPNGTHYEGANVDIAYYIDPAYHTFAGNLTYRQICCDAPLSDWSCVDTNTASSNYGNCVAGSESTHIVDLPRTALFVAKLVASGRIRIIGFEAKVQAGLESAMDDLVTAGVLTASEAATAKSFVTTSLNHSSWIWHFNHMHASFCTGDCPQAKVDGGVRQGPMRELPLDTQSDLVRAYHQQRQLAP